MSAAARRLVALRFGYRELLDRPRNTPEWHQAVADARWRLTAWADHIIGWGC